MPKEKPCKICKVKKLPHELDEKGRCPSCQDSHKADLSGMSYGKWMARFKPPKEHPEAQEEEKKQPVIDESIIVPGLNCVICGKPIPLGAHSTVTCGDADCKYRRQMDINNAWQRRHHAQKREERKPIACMQCGKVFTPVGWQKRCCSPECTKANQLAKKQEASRRSALRARAEREALKGAQQC